MNEPLNLRKIFYFDIEAVPMAPSIEAMPEHFRTAWLKKTKDWEPSSSSHYDKMALYSEFNKIVCISFVYLSKEGVLTGTTISAETEELIVSRFASLVDQFIESRGGVTFVGHGIADYDLPLLYRKRIVYRSPWGPIFSTIAQMKPWEVQKFVYDTLLVWRASSHRYTVSLDSLCAVFGVPSPKVDMDGSLVPRVYYDGGLQRIISYCESDVTAVAGVHHALNNALAPDIEWKPDTFKW